MLKKVRKIRKALRGSGIILFGLLFSVYFSYHLLNGKRGVFAYKMLEKEVANLEMVAENLDQSRRDMEHKISLLSASSLDLDQLDESARVVLSMAKDGEYVIYY